MEPMPLCTYRDIISFIQSYNGTFRDCEISLRAKFSDLPAASLGSILSLTVQRLMKQKYRKNASISSKYFEQYEDLIKNKNGNIFKLAQESGITSALFARTLLGHRYTNQNELRKNIKDTTQIEDKDLALQTYLAIISDNQYGPYVDNVKQSIGCEYEIRLERELRLLNIPYSDETVLRARGYDKTPDFKLEVPIAVDGFIIHWIESKALFGDDENHFGYLKDQLTCYWNRFGPGLIIYWFGYLETIEQTPEVNKMFILRSRFPSKGSITMYKMDD